MSGDAMLELSQLTKTFSTGRNVVHAVQGVSLTIEPGSTYGLVGESGCGKSTVARMIVGLNRPTSGEIKFQGTNIRDADKNELAASIQMIFQDPYSSFNPRLTVGQTLVETLAIRRWGDKKRRVKKVVEMLERVGFSATDADKLPHQFSGGQRQRIAIARAIIVEPQLVVCDEPVSALDVSLQAQVLNLLKQLQRELGLSLLFISHDMSVIRFVSDTIGVMYAGRLVEEGETGAVLSNPKHPYTRALLSAVPQLPGERKVERVALRGELSAAEGDVKGCLFKDRCPAVMPICHSVPPAQHHLDDGRHWVECHLYVAEGNGLPGRSYVPAGKA